MDTIPLSVLIWVSVQPIIRLFLCVACGFAITKAGLFSPTAAVGAGQIVINITFPMLCFSKIVPAFDSKTIGSVGPLFLVAILYETFGLAMSWVIKQSFWVPHRFRYGILVAGGWANIGDIPTAIVMSLMASAPFNGTQDENLAVAYLSVFVLVYIITLFTLGGMKWIEMDYAGEDVEDEEVRERLCHKQKKIATAFASLARRVFRLSKKKRESDAETFVAAVGERASIKSDGANSGAVPQKHSQDEKRVESNKAETAPVSTQRQMIRKCYYMIRAAMSPPSLSIVVSFIISVVPTLKALFVSGVPGVDISPAPDGQPPLAVLMNTASFIGAASVPLGLMSLGCALARLQFPRGSWRSFPIAAISALAVAKLMVMPVFGVLICQGLTHVGVIDPGNHVLRFICIFMSCLPTSTTQVLLTQVYSGTGTATHLAAFLIPQYILMFGTMTGLTAYTLLLLFG
ncbi:auxin efflux carrier [Scleroderma yunnanense]